MKTEIINKIREMGIVGAGGAGFPTYAKLYEGAKYILLNAAECEPIFKVDQMLMTNHPYEVLKGFDILIDVCSATKGIIGLKETYKDSIESLEKNQDMFKKIEIKKMKDVYPLGDELVLIYEAFRESIPQGKIPRSRDIIVVNVETCYNVYQAIVNNLPVVEKYLTLGGEVETQKVVKVPIGIKIKDLVTCIGEIKTKDYEIIVGGPMTGQLGSLETVITKTTKGILFFPKYKKVVTNRKNSYKQLKNQAMSACSQCQMCTDLCPRNQLGYDIEPHKIMNTVAYEINYKDLMSVFSCCECNLCSLYSCHQELNPMRVISEIKSKLREAGIKGVEKEVSPKGERIYRQVPGKSLKQRLGLVQYDKKIGFYNCELDVKDYYIELKQSIGGAPIPCVKVGDMVKKNQEIATCTEGLCVGLHSPIDGHVMEINNKYILLQRGE